MHGNLVISVNMLLNKKLKFKIYIYISTCNGHYFHCLHSIKIHLCVLHTFSSWHKLAFCKAKSHWSLPLSWSELIFENEESLPFSSMLVYWFLNNGPGLWGSKSRDSSHVQKQSHCLSIMLNVCEFVPLVDLDILLPNSIYIAIATVSPKSDPAMTSDGWCLLSFIRPIPQSIAISTRVDCRKIFSRRENRICKRFST